MFFYIHVPLYLHELSAVSLDIFMKLTDACYDLRGCFWVTNALLSSAELSVNVFTADVLKRCRERKSRHFIRVSESSLCLILEAFYCYI